MGLQIDLSDLEIVVIYTLSLSDIAELANVTRSAVSNWRKRYEDFPKGRYSGDHLRFEEKEVVDWLAKKGYSTLDRSHGMALWLRTSSVRNKLSTEDFEDLILGLAVGSKYITEDILLNGSSKHSEDPIPKAAQEKFLTLLVEKDILTNEAAEFLRDNRRYFVKNDLVAYLAEIEPNQLAKTIDYVLARSAKLQKKLGADYGFIGSNTSKLLSSLALNSSGRILDPACGIGNVLISIGIKEKYKRIVGIDVNERALRIAKNRAILYGVEAEFLQPTDVLQSEPLPNELFDVVVAEPPFAMRWDSAIAITDSRYKYGIPPKSNSEFAWLQVVISKLSDKGRGYVLTPLGPLYRASNERSIRQQLLIHNKVAAIVELPGKILPNTSIPLALWVLDSENTTGEVLFVDASQESDFIKTVPAFLTNNIYNSAKSKIPSRSVSIKEILQTDETLNLLPSKWISREEINYKNVVSNFDDAVSNLETGLTNLAKLSPTIPQIESKTISQKHTFRSLIDEAFIEINPLRRAKFDDYEESVRPSVISSSRLREEYWPQILENFQISNEPGTTIPGDILITKKNRKIHSVVDSHGGHFVDNFIDVIRIRNQEIINPYFLALQITGSWNESNFSSNLIPRLLLNDLEVSLPSKSFQDSFVQKIWDLHLIKAEGLKLISAIDEITKSSLEAIHYEEEGN